MTATHTNFTTSEHILADDSASRDFAQQFAQTLGAGDVVFFHGDLGAGKTFFCRHILHTMGYKGKVLSPTYSLVHEYDCIDQRQGQPISAYHFDLYRLADPEELEFIGARDYFSPRSLCLVEWPDMGRGFLPAANFDITLASVSTQNPNSRLLTLKHFK